MTSSPVYLKSICGNSSIDWALWSNSMTWETAYPDLTLCFETTVLQWIPCGIFWLTSLFYIPHLTKKRSIGRHTSSKLNDFKKCLCLVLLIVAIIDLGEAISDSSNVNMIVPPVRYLNPFIQILTMILAIITIRLELVKGIHSSGWLYLFWFLEFVAYVIIFASQIIRLTKETHNSFYIATSITSSIAVFTQFFAHCFADKAAISTPKPDSGEQYGLLQEEEVSSARKCPEDRASFLSRITFAWITSLVIRGYRRDLTEDDVWELRPQDKCDYIFPRSQHYWEKELKKTSDALQQTVVINGYRYSKSNRGDSEIGDDSYHLLQAVQKVKRNPNKKISQPSFFMVLTKVFGWYYLFVGCMKFVSEMIVFVQPQLLKQLINFISTNSPYVWHGYAIGVALFLVGMVRTMFFQQYFYGSFALGMQLRTATISLVYRKALKLSGTARKDTTVGEIVNLMSVDAQKLQDVPIYLHNIWTAPVVIAVAMIFLWQELGASSLAGVALMAVLIPINGYIATQVKRLQVTQMNLKDQRIKLMNEVLNGIKVLKLYAWESSFREKVSGIRNEELSVLKKAAFINVGGAVTWFCAPFLVALLSFLVFVLSSPENILTSEKAFVSLSLFNIINFPLAILPSATTVAVQFYVSLKRLNKYLTGEELDPKTVTNDPSALDAVRIDNGNFSWDLDLSPTLNNINVQIPEGRLYAVVGTVGAGKSSLISAMLGEMLKSNGRVTVKGRVAYVPQQAWCQNCSLKDNILFGRPLRQAKYDDVLDACALTPDLKVLAAGDRTEIGERGINLSGGQKQRVSLARAVYQDADIYLLDDPLSAVDSHVGKHLFDRVISETGLLANKTRVLVTHGLSFLSKVDYILVMTDGRISEMGTYHELLSHDGPFAEFIRTHLEQDEEIEEDVEPEGIRKKSKKKSVVTVRPKAEMRAQVLRTISTMSGSDTDKSRSRRISGKDLSKVRRSSHHRRQSSAADVEYLARQEKENEKLMTSEKAETGSVKLSVFSSYIKALTYKAFAVLFCSYIGYITCQVSTNLWLSVWSEDESVANDTGKRDMYLGVYGALGAGQTIFIFIESISLAYGSFLASRHIHFLLLKNILRAPMSFFDTTPLGRILNRFSKDTDTVDLNIPMILRDWLATLANVLGTLIVVSIASPIFLVALIPLSVCYVLAQRVYVRTARQLKRIDSVKRSPIYSHFQESLVGATSIRAYKRQTDFIKHSDLLVDQNQEIWYATIISNRWVSVILQTIGNIIILLAAVFAVASRTTIGAGLAGASVTYSLQVTGAFNYFVRMTCDLETYIVAVERMLEFAEVETEAPLFSDRRLPQSWPSEGRIEFRKYSVRYRPGLDLVLRSIDATINSGEMVGIVGRTGAGKSSLTMGLFRILEPASGDIVIDGISVRDLGLHDLRSHLTIIPQDPVLFSGSLRMNLDPFDAYSDSAVWTALEQAHLKSFVNALPEGLDHQCSEGGENLSVGQRQLVCLARALLRRTKVLVLDEATAAVDLETDDLIQDTIRREFKGCTIMTIAHRLNTIMDYDRIMVLDKGEVREMDSPASLLQQTNSIFYGMCSDAGLA